ncbi:MAG TPA: hypothetical protein VGH53_02645 [Streptosporangiaceae bacterium]
MTQPQDRPAAASTISRNTLPARPPAWLTALRERLPRSPRHGAVAAVRLIAVAGLSIDAYVHLDLASTYSEAQAPVNEGILFRAAAVLALFTALALIKSARRLPLMLGFAVSASALALMLLSRYVDLGPLGPFPDLYDPVWFPEKLWAAGGEAAAAIASVTGILLHSIRPCLRRGSSF